MADTKQPVVGDLAYHVDGHDPREVTRVEQMGGKTVVYLDILGSETGPLPASNYTFEAEGEPA